MDRRRNVSGVVAGAASLLALLLLLLIASVATAQPSTDYVRPAASPLLPLDHPLIARKSRSSCSDKAGLCLFGREEEEREEESPRPQASTRQRRRRRRRRQRSNYRLLRARTTRSSSCSPSPGPGPWPSPGSRTRRRTKPDAARGEERGAREEAPRLGLRPPGGPAARECRPLRSLAPPSPPSPSPPLVASPEEDLPLSAEGTFTCYEADDYLSGALHSATMGAGAGGPLVPGRLYSYAVGSPALGVWSSVRTFLAPASPDAGSLPYRIAVVGRPGPDGELGGDPGGDASGLRLWGAAAAGQKCAARSPRRRPGTCSTSATCPTPTASSPAGTRGAGSSSRTPRPCPGW